MEQIKIIEETLFLLKEKSIPYQDLYVTYFEIKGVSHAEFDACLNELIENKFVRYTGNFNDSIEIILTASGEEMLKEYKTYQDFLDSHTITLFERLKRWALNNPVTVGIYVLFLGVVAIGSLTIPSFLHHPKKPLITSNQKIVTNSVRDSILITAAKMDSIAAKGYIRIGTQLWSTTNLNQSTFRNGEHIPEAETADEWMQANVEGNPAWCYYDGNPADSSKYGKLYNWYAVHDSRGLAPKGWHIPTDEEWSMLVNYLGGGKEAGYKMKSSVGWENKGNGNNSSSFSAFPVGHRNLSGLFHYRGLYINFWTSSETDKFTAWYRLLNCDDSEVYHYSYYKGYGFSVRCVKNETINE